MAGNLTFAIIKPDAVGAGHTGKIIDRIISGGFRIRAMKMIHQTRQQAEGFYEVHRGKPFYEGLTEFMSSAPCVVMVLEKEDAVKAWRDLMGATDPAKADARPSASWARAIPGGRAWRGGPDLSGQDCPAFSELVRCAVADRAPTCPEADHRRTLP